MNHQVKSAGTDPGAQVKLTQKFLDWADIVFVMEKKHKEIIQQKFQSQALVGKIIVLDIPDEYQYMDEELIFSIKTATSPYLENE